MKKNEIRNKFREIRNNIINREEKDFNATKLFLNLDYVIKANSILLYHSYKSELGTIHIIEKLSKSKNVFLPITVKETCEIKIGKCNADNLTIGNYSILEPSEVADISIEEIDLVLIPGVAFDRSGNRLGQGKGYYDRFLKNYNGLKVGFAYSEQIYKNTLPTTPLDIKVDMIVTDKEVIVCSL